MGNLESDANNISFQNSESVFNLKILLETLSRRRRLVINVASAILFLFFCYAFSSKKVWMGEFQIVLNKKDILMGKNKYNITNEILELVNKSNK